MNCMQAGNRFRVKWLENNQFGPVWRPTGWHWACRATAVRGLPQFLRETGLPPDSSFRLSLGGHRLGSDRGTLILGRNS